MSPFSSGKLKIPCMFHWAHKRNFYIVFYKTMLLTSHLFSEEESLPRILQQEDWDDTDEQHCDQAQHSDLQDLQALEAAVHS